MVQTLSIHILQDAFSSKQLAITWQPTKTGVIFLDIFGFTHIMVCPPNPKRRRHGLKLSNRPLQSSRLSSSICWAVDKLLGNKLITKNQTFEFCEMHQVLYNMFPVVCIH